MLSIQGSIMSRRLKFKKAKYPLATLEIKTKITNISYRNVLFLLEG